MSDPIDDLYDAIEKAKGLLHGGSKASALRLKRFARRSGKPAQELSWKNPNTLGERAADYLANRKTGGPRGTQKRIGSYK